jgi:hypothetical protein
MRYLAFLVVMRLSITVVRGLNWPSWLQVVAVILVNLVAGGLSFGTQEQDTREAESQ